MRVKLFWTRFENEESCDEWTGKTIQLSPLHKMTLESHRGKNEVDLYTYQKIEGVPDFIKVKRANLILSSMDAYETLRRGHSIAHLSDYIRLSAAIVSGSGIVMDMDNTCLRALPDCGFISSIPAKATGGMAVKWGKNRPPITVNNDSWDGRALSNFPIGVTPDMVPHIRKILDKVLQVLSSDKKLTKWNFIMHSLAEIPKHVKSCHAFEPLYFCPLPAWLLHSGKCYSLESPTRLTGSTELFGYKLPSIAEIFDKSYVIQHWFESTTVSGSDIKSTIWDTISPDCLLAQEAEYVLGESWRFKLTGKRGIKKVAKLF